MSATCVWGPQCKYRCWPTSLAAAVCCPGCCTIVVHRVWQVILVLIMAEMYGTICRVSYLVFACTCSQVHST
jgi:hypothetical protein